MTDLIHDPAVCKTGARVGVKAPRVMLRDYAASPDVFKSAPQVVINSAPTRNGRGSGPQFPLATYLNDNEGDCTCAAIGNILRVNSQGRVRISNAAVQTAYVAVTGEEGAAFDPATGANDNGCIPLDVLDYWVRVGVGGDKLLGHAGVDMTNKDEVRWVLWQTGSVYQAINLATEQQSQHEWDYVPGSRPGSWGGHLFPLFDHPAAGQWVGGTWGAYKRQTTKFMLNQATEGHALITDVFLDANMGVIDVEKLRYDLGLLKPEQ